MVRWTGWIVAGALVFFSFFWAIGLAPVQAGGEGADEMLTQVLKNQEKMMKDLELIKQELNRIRIRTR